MDWAKDFYTHTGAWFGATGIQPSHRIRAASIERLCGTGPKRILELGAGAGGTAAALAELGHEVIAIELAPNRASFARALSQEPRTGRMTVIEADFYMVAVPGTFDVVAYWNGFGIGSDDDQRRVLQRMAHEWLAPSGCVVLDIFSPWRLAREAGTQERFPALANNPDTPAHINRRDFDLVECRFVDRWWAENDGEAGAISQSIRCYSPVDFMLLLAGTGLVPRRWEVNGQPLSVDDAPEAVSTSALWDTWSYLVQLVADPKLRQG